MRITVVPASTKTGRETISALLAFNSHLSLSVVGVYRDLGKIPGEFKSDPRFEGRVGDVEDAASLDFAGSDVVVYGLPPCYAPGIEPVERARVIAENVKGAVEKGGVGRVVYVSSMGAQYASGVGEIETNYVTEKVLANAAADVVFVRCAYFMENWAMALDGAMAEEPFLVSTITPAEHAIPMVSVKDIGKALASQALATSAHQDARGWHVVEVYGPQAFSSKDVQHAFEQVTGKKIDLRLIQKGDLEEFYRGIFGDERMVGLFVEMAASLLPGALLSKEDKEGDEGGKTIVRGTDGLVDALERMVRG